MLSILIKIPYYLHYSAQSPEEMKILEAISEAYGVDISAAKNQPPHVRVIFSITSKILKAILG